MARRDYRSPDRSGNNFGRYRREDERYPPRDGGRRDFHRGGDRRFRDSRDEYRPQPPRDRSRDRRRSRSPHPPPNRDRRRSRDRDFRRRDDSRERDRRRDDGRRGSGPRPDTHPRNSPVVNTEEEEMVKRRAKLEAWKAKQLAEQQKKAKEAGTKNSTVALLEEMDRKESSNATTPAANSPPVSADSPGGSTVHAKFDPKTIARRVMGSGASKSTLGQDIALPFSAQKLAITKHLTSGPLADKSKAANAASDSSRQIKAAGKVGGFGIAGRSAADAVSKKTLDFEDEQDSERKLEKLPNLQLEEYDDDDAALANTPGSDTGDVVDWGDAATEEELAALAARRAAAENGDAAISMALIATGDSAMPDAPDTVEDNAMALVPAEEEQEEEEDAMDVDPLDAFMSNLDTSAPKPRLMLTGTRKQVEPETIYAEDDLSEIEGVVDDDILALANRKKKKELKPVDHKKIQYEDFKKEFYVEPVALKEMTDEELANLRYELGGIKTRGKDVPKPLLGWPQMGLSNQALNVIRDLKYEKPTPIQSQAIPAIMAGRDVIGVAKTGSGKTMAFLLPMFRHIKDQRPLRKLDGPIAIILAPTRELANQIFGECKPFLKALDLNAVVCFGQASLKDNIDKLKQGVEIVVATPGRLIDLATVNSGRLLNFRRVTYFVLDEADRLWDMGFAPQVEALIGQIRPDRQFVMFSATFPQSMEQLARKVLKKPVEIIVGGRAAVAPEITQIIEIRPQKTKFVRLLGILGDLYDTDEEARTLIFVERQEAADELLSALLKKGYPCGSIHGGKDQIDRSSTIDDFKAGAIPIMIATSVAARGLDVKQLKLVINYDVPSHLEDYVHRAGRTGRAGQTGTCITFITDEQDRYAPDMVKALKQSGKEVPDDLKQMAEDFLNKVKDGKAKATSLGFGGKGIEKIDEARDLERSALRKQYRTGDEPAEEDKAKEKKEDEIIIHSASEKPAAQPKQPSTLDLLDPTKIKVHKREEPPPSSDPLERARQAASSIGGRLTRPNALRPGQSVDNRGPDAGAYHATLEINDHPQKARWAVTNRTNVAKILEQTGVSITSKGVYYGAGKEPGVGDLPKLYLLVEGDTEAVVMTAMRELMRLLREGTLAAMESEARYGRTTTRYDVV